MSQERTNTSIAITNQAVESMRVFNNSKSMDIYEKLLKSQEAIDDASNAQKNQAFPELLAATAIVVSMLASTVIIKNTNFLPSLTQASSAGTSIWSKNLEGNITSHTHESRVAETARERISNTQHSTDKSITDIAEQVGRLNQKDV